MNIDPGKIRHKIGSQPEINRQPQQKDPNKSLLSPVDLVTGNSGIDSGNAQRITLLHTNDLHGHLEAFAGKKPKDSQVGGLPSLSTKIEQERSKNKENTLVVDSGDISTGSPVSDYFHALPIVEAMNQIGYDAMAVGNHDIDEGVAHLKGITEKARFPILSANLTDKTPDRKLEGVQPYIIKKVGGFNVGILGLTTTEAMSMLSPEDRSQVELTAACKAVEQNLPEMKKNGADLVLLLSHLGIDQDRKLAETLKGIDLIIGGHSHTEINKLEKVGDTYITQSGCFGKNLGRVDLEVVREKGKPRIKKAQGKLISIKPSKTPPDKNVQGIIQKYSQKLGPILNRKIGKAMVDLSQPDYHHHKSESPLANFVSDSLRKKCRTDISLITTSSLRSNIPKGNIKMGQLHQVFPWTNKVTRLKMKGRDIKQVMEEAIGGPAHGMAISGFNARIDTSQPQGQKVIDMKTSDGKPFDLDKEYTVATRDWLADGNAGLGGFKNAIHREETSEMIRDVIIDAIEKKGNITARLDGRLVDENQSQQA
ncbi:MAG: bifunctional metallophosphatase/5'-nucleotidase [Vulcanimicrobiota bacterium]